MRAGNSLEYRKSIISGALIRANLRRFLDRISDDLASNFERLEKGEWNRTLRECNRLTRNVGKKIECEVADVIDGFKGFGSKQSRNLLQDLGITRYEIPIDSRVTNWLNDGEFPFKLSATALADPGFYRFLSDGIQELCMKSDVFPCIFDAAVFASADDGGADIGLGR